MATSKVASWYESSVFFLVSIEMDLTSTLRFRSPELRFFTGKSNSPLNNSLKHQAPILIRPKKTVSVTTTRTRTHLTVKAKVEGISDKFKWIELQNLDFAPARRQVRSAFAEEQSQLDHCLFKFVPSGIKTEEWYERNSNGLQIFCKSWMPKRIKGALFFCHGYGDTCTFFFEGIARYIAASGYGVYALDHPGFGLSDGLHGYISKFDDLVNNVIETYTKIKGRPELRSVPRFIMGQSMGGAVTLKVHLKEPREWDGVILVAPMCKIVACLGVLVALCYAYARKLEIGGCGESIPELMPWGTIMVRHVQGPLVSSMYSVRNTMLPEKFYLTYEALPSSLRTAHLGKPRNLSQQCSIPSISQDPRISLKSSRIDHHDILSRNIIACKIAEEMIPPPPVLKVLSFMSNVMPKAKLFPQKDLAALAFRDIRKREMAVYNVICYGDRTRLRTGVELLKATSDIEKQVDKVSAPLLILHGAADKVTDPKVSQFLYERASSTDKTLNLYEEGFHCILEGEPDDRIFTVLNDIISWLDEKCSYK
ncbi:hypothetical protein JRO89_XS05G0262300 [Xanthoceras sorbifolium]|uniref:Serine aminopeptidase S33 domain-containing protein n=1 Tax=Xanthoceras sorbifolium TaxID=99658 RepID=A0ABQ8I3J3_9ROSI|nr:hypothetical protein JRO89_XS05G0262300 [Xanthoceras sorbifolium]